MFSSEQTIVNIEKQVIKRYISRQIKNKYNEQTRLGLRALCIFRVFVSTGVFLPLFRTRLRMGRKMGLIQAASWGWQGKGQHSAQGQGKNNSFEQMWSNKKETVISWAYINQMFGNQVSQNQQEYCRTTSHNWLGGEAFQRPNSLGQSYFLPFSHFTEPNFDRSMFYFWVVPCVTYDDSRQNSSHVVAVSNDDESHSKEVKNPNKKIKTDMREPKSADKKRRKIIELQNIKENERNRNILSNCLKLAIKSIRNSLREQHSYFNKIIKARKLNYSMGQFEQKLNQLLPCDINYIRPALVKQMFELEQQQFTLVLKIFIKKFFKQEIYASNGKHTAMKKLIKGQHIKAGRKLLGYLFPWQNPAQGPENN